MLKKDFVVDTLWTPWRMAYIGGAKSEGCVFCQAAAADPTTDREHYVLYRGAHSFVILNAFPYNSGHVMIVPYIHTSDLTHLEVTIAAEIMDFAQRMTALLTQTYTPDGFNLGMNLGKVAGAGIDTHLHMHVVPRWGGDTNFMPLVAQTRVLPEWLDDTYDRLAKGVSDFFPPSVHDRTSDQTTQQ